MLIPNILAGYGGGYAGQDRGPKCLRFNLEIDAGARLSARMSSERASNTARVAVKLSDHGGIPRWRCGRVVDTIAGTSPSGIAVTAGRERGARQLDGARRIAPQRTISRRC